MKKLRFPLKMANDVEVRSMDELRANFSISRVMDYLLNGKLALWLRDRNIKDIVEEIENLDIQDEKLPKKLFDIFNVPYDEVSVEEMKKVSLRKKRIHKLRHYTDNQQYESVIDNVAFTQDELYNLVNTGVDTIYLCGDKFCIPLSNLDISYIGINRPELFVDSKEKVDLKKRKISVENVEINKKYLGIFNSVGSYSGDSYINFMLSAKEKKQAETLFELAKPAVEELNYNIDDDINKLREIAIKSKLINLASDFLKKL